MILRPCRPLSAACVLHDTGIMTIHFRSNQTPTGLARFRPDLTQPLAFDGALRALKTICAASREPTGGRPYDTQVSESAEHGLVSTMRSALLHSRVDEADVRQALPDLAQHAAAAARARGNATPSEAASRARRALRLLTGLEPEATKLDAPHLFLSAGFIELQTFAARRQDRTKLVILGRTCAAMGAYHAPQVMPTVEDLSDFAEQPTSPYAGNTVRNAISAYRRIRRFAVQQSPARAGHFADIALRPPARSRVCRRLPVIPTTTDHETSPIAALAVALRDHYPRIATELELYLRSADAATVSHPWHSTIRHATLRMVSLLDAFYLSGAEAHQIPPTSEVRLWHLYQCDVSLQTPRQGEADDAFFAAIGALNGSRGPLIQRLLLDDAPHARRESALGGADAVQDAWIPEVCVRNECAIWSLITSVYGERLAAGDWATQKMRRTIVADWLHQSKAGVAVRADREIDKVWLVTHLSLPLLMCVGVPWMAHTARRCRAEWLRLRTGGAPEHLLAHAYKRYALALHDYCAVAIIGDDGMRRKNYANARHGRHVTTTYVDGRLTGVQLRFGVDRRRDPAALKIIERGRRAKRKVGRRVQDHVHDLSPTAVDFELVDWWFREVAPGFSYQRPTPSHRDASATALDGLYLFPSAPRSHRFRRQGGELSSRVADAMHAVIRMLHGDAVPATRAELARPQRNACTMHRIRLLLATYWGGVRNDWAYAEHLTADLESTLKEHYSEAMSSAVTNMLQGRTDHWRHPRLLDDLMDAMREQAPVRIVDDTRVQAILSERTLATPDLEAIPRSHRWCAKRRRRAVSA